MKESVRGMAYSSTDSWVTFQGGRESGMMPVRRRRRGGNCDREQRHCMPSDMRPKSRSGFLHRLSAYGTTHYPRQMETILRGLPVDIRHLSSSGITRACCNISNAA